MGSVRIKNARGKSPQTPGEWLEPLEYSADTAAIRLELLKTERT